jgi:hypothetical protein
MYQSPVAAIAEMVSNSWDAEAEAVRISLPTELNADSEIIVSDNGNGMTFNECEQRYLKVGWYRRETGDGQKSGEKQRPVLGRKGIGKFAGFGIADIISIDTISKETGERTKFHLDINQLRTHEYVAEGGDIDVDSFEPKDEKRAAENHGTTIRLTGLKLKRRLSIDSFKVSMARRFLLMQRVEDFSILVNDDPLPNGEQIEKIEYIFPRDYKPEQKPENLNIIDGWGVEKLSANREIKWKINFYREPIDEEELTGIAIFSRGKLAQKPFFFNLSGGLSGQHGQEYMSGKVEADYIDDLPEDIIATERQRINWEHEQTLPLENWGQQRVRQLLGIWRDRRGEERRRRIEEKVLTFSSRLDKLPPHEKRTVNKAITHLASIPALSEEQFQELGASVLTAWEQGRLRALIDEIAEREVVDTEWLLSTLAEADVLIALNVAEAVRTKLEAINGLRRLINKRELENSVRDFIAEKPYLLDSKWETFKKEISVRRFMEEAAQEAGLKDEEDDGQRKRIDLALRSGEHLLIVEFMRPGLRADWDHLSRCRRYIHLIREKIEPQTALGIKKITGLIVADYLDDDAGVRRELSELVKTDIYAYDWESLLDAAEKRWSEFLDILGQRAPQDERLDSIQKH